MAAQRIYNKTVVTFSLPSAGLDLSVHCVVDRCTLLKQLIINHDSNNEMAKGMFFL
jgi:hypothetical protein